MLLPAKLTLASLVLILMSQPASLFYVPGVAPQDFSAKEAIDVRAIKMTSAHTQLPFEYYSLEFCKPKSGVVEYFCS